MNKIFLAGVSTILSLLTCAQKNYEVKGTIKGLTKDTTVYLILKAKNDTIALANTHNGKFDFKGVLPTSIEWALIGVAGITNSATFFLENKKIQINGSVENWDSAIVTGSKETECWYELHKLTDPIANAIARNNKIETNDTSQQNIQKLIIERDAKNKILTDSFVLVRDKFINSHRNYVYAAWLIWHNRDYDATRKQQEYDKLTPRVKESNFGQELLSDIKNLSLRKVIKEGGQSPDFVVQTKDGQKISLREAVAKNKLTLVDFWASWCVPCRKSIPELKKIYTEFSDDGFNILSISSDKSAIEWQKALEEENTPWLNTRYIEGQTNPSSIYDIQAIPAFVLLDQGGKIIAIDCAVSSIPSFGFKSKEGGGPDVFNTVKELLEKMEKEKRNGSKGK